MIPLYRTRTASAIKAMYRGANKKTKDIELMLARRLFLNDGSKPLAFKSTFWKASKVQLKKESFGKCAYCEADTGVVAHGDVEHYRPKSIYWWLAYTYDNYLFACQICNQVYKSDNFLIMGQKLREPAITHNSTDEEIDALSGKISPDPLDVLLDYGMESFLQAHAAEQVLLLNPYFDDPTLVMAYQADDIKQEVAIVAAHPGKQKSVKAMEDFYGINRLELKNLRYRTFSKFRAFKMAYPVIEDEAIKTEIKKQISDMLSPQYTFAGMNRYFDALL